MELNGFGLDQQLSGALPLVTTKITITVIHNMLLFWTSESFLGHRLSKLIGDYGPDTVLKLNSSYHLATISIIRIKIE